MLSMEQFRTLAGRTVVGRDGEKIGKIDQLYADSTGGEPTFVTVETGLFGTKTTFVPVGDASLSGDDVSVPYTKDQVKDAPSVDPDGELSAEEEDRLYAHYGIGGGQAAADTEIDDRTATGTSAPGAVVGGFETGRDTTDVDSGTTGAVGRDTSGPTTDDAMTRSEERLAVGTQTREAGRARLRKYVVEEDVTETVPVSREEVRVEREPITEGNRGQAYDGPAISEEEHEVVLHEERPVVEKEAVPVERVRLGTETVTEERTVNETVRKEEIDVDSGTEARTDQR